MQTLKVKRLKNYVAAQAGQYWTLVNHHNMLRVNAESIRQANKCMLDGSCGNGLVEKSSRCRSIAKKQAKLRNKS